MVKLIPININIVINIKHNLFLIPKYNICILQKQKFFNNIINIKNIEILYYWLMLPLKLNYFIDFIYLSMIFLIIKFYKYFNINILMYIIDLFLIVNYFRSVLVIINNRFPICFFFYNFFLLVNLSLNSFYFTKYNLNKSIC